MAKRGTEAMRKGRARILIVLVAIVGFLMIFARLFYLQVILVEELQSRTTEQQLRDTTIQAKRGSILDCNGNILAQSVTAWDIELYPNMIDLKNTAACEQLVEGLYSIYNNDLEDGETGWEKEKIWKVVNSGNSYYRIEKQADETTKNQVAELIKRLADREDSPMTGVLGLKDTYRRQYTHDYFAGAVLGIVSAVQNDQDSGQFGLEQQYDEELKGNPGRIVVAKGADNTPLPNQFEQKFPATDGNTLVLTIDENIQSIMEKYVQETVEEFRVANRGVAVMMDVKTGGVLGMACMETFNSNDPRTLVNLDVQAQIDSLPEEKRAEAKSQAIQRQWRNKAISDTYVPGSVYKMVTASAVLSEGLYDEKLTRYECSGSYVPFPGSTSIDCWNAFGHGTQTLEQALCNSCNPAFMQMGFSLGRRAYYDYFNAFGFNEPTGIDLPGESDSIFFHNDPEHYGMTQSDLAVASFGQNFNITPIQMITACSAIANGGKLMRPYVVSRIEDSEKNVVQMNEPYVKRQAVSESVAKQVCSMLATNVRSGGAKNGYVPGYRIGGKTGTSEKKTDDFGNPSDDYIASFCGIAPADDPQVALLCFFDSPDKDINYYGTTVAAPCFRKIMAEVLPYLGVERVFAEDEVTMLDTTTGDYTNRSVEEAEAAALKDKLKVEIVGEGDTVIAQNPAAYAKLPADGTVMLYTDEESRSERVVVPDFKGCNLNDANFLASTHKLNLCIVGSAISDSTSYVQKQDIEADQEVAPYTVITVEFSQQNSIM